MRSVLLFKIGEKVKSALPVLFVFLLSVAPASAQKKWTLQECIDYALDNNITLQKSRLQQQSAEEELKGKKGALLPTLSAQTSQNVGYQPWKDTGISTVTNGQVNALTNKTSYSGSYGVNAQWTVWNGNRNRNNVRLSELSAEVSSLAAEQQANTIQERIAQIFTQILYLDESVKVNEKLLETAKKNEERGKQLVEVGSMSKADLAQLTAQRASSEYNIVETRSQLRNYKLQLKQLLEITDAEPFDVAIPVTEEQVVLAEVPELQTVYDQALQTRPEIESSRLSIKQSDVSLSIAKAAWLPTVSLSGGLSTSTNSLSNNGWGSQMKTNTGLSGGLSLSVPIFDGRQTKTSVNKAKIAQLEAQLNLQEQQKQLYATIEQYWLDAETSQQKYRAAKASVDSEQQSFELLQEQFRLGLKNIIELMTGQDKLLQAEQSMLQAKYTALLNMQLLNFYRNGKM